MTSSERYVEIDGRRWRATDPSIPDAFRQALVDELMAARRAVGAATRAGSAEAERDARARVQDAKVALGERGEPWWESPSDDGRRRRIGSTVRALLRSRRPTASICPSDVARAIGGDSWRALLPVVREVLAEFVAHDVVAVTQGAERIDPATARGPVRVRRGDRFPGG